MYNTETYEIEVLPCLNISRIDHSSCGFNNKNNQSFIYVIGGYTSHDYLNSIEKYDEADNSKWSLIELSLDVFPVRISPGTIQLNEFHILVFGGSF